MKSASPPAIRVVESGEMFRGHGEIGIQDRHQILGCVAEAQANRVGLPHTCLLKGEAFVPPSPSFDDPLDLLPGSVTGMPFDEDDLDLGTAKVRQTLEGRFDVVTLITCGNQDGKGRQILACQDRPQHHHRNEREISQERNARKNAVEQHPQAE